MISAAKQRFIDLVPAQPQEPAEPPIETQIADLKQRVQAIESDLGDAPAEA